MLPPPWQRRRRPVGKHEAAASLSADAGVPLCAATRPGQTRPKKLATAAERWREAAECGVNGVVGGAEKASSTTTNRAVSRSLAAFCLHTEREWTTVHTDRAGAVVSSLRPAVPPHLFFFGWRVATPTALRAQAQAGAGRQAVGRACALPCPASEPPHSSPHPSSHASASASLLLRVSEDGQGGRGGRHVKAGSARLARRAAATGE